MVEGPIWTARARQCYDVPVASGGAVAQLGARLDGIEEVVGSNPIGSTNFFMCTVRRDPLQNVPET